MKTFNCDGPVIGLADCWWRKTQEVCSQPEVYMFEEGASREVAQSPISTNGDMKRPYSQRVTPHVNEAEQ